MKSPRGTGRAFKLPKFYIKLVSLLIHNINWISTTIGILSIIILYVMKYLNERFKSKVHIIFPCELILVSSFLSQYVKSCIYTLGNYWNSNISFYSS